MAKRILEAILVLALVWLCLSIDGCNTLHGAGQDLTTITEPYVD